VVQLHAEAAQIPVGDGEPQALDALGGGVAVVGGLLRRLGELLHDVLRRGQVGVAHAQVDDVRALVAHLHLEFVDLGEDIRRQAVDTGKLIHGALLLLSSLLRPVPIQCR
jgi:hypothetical protein